MCARHMHSEHPASRAAAMRKGVSSSEGTEQEVGKRWTESEDVGGDTKPVNPHSRTSTPLPSLPIPSPRHLTPPTHPRSPDPRTPRAHAPCTRERTEGEGTLRASKQLSGVWLVGTRGAVELGTPGAVLRGDRVRGFMPNE